MKILVVTDEYPWPTRTGYRQRIAHVVAALATVAEVDLLSVVLDDAPGRPEPDATLRRTEVVIGGRNALSRPVRLARWAFGRSPRSLLWRDWTAARDVLTRLLRDGYDAVWFSHATTFLALADLIGAPAIVDLDNLESELLRHQRRVTRSAADAVDERRWRRLETRIAGTARYVVVCSELDRRRLGSANARVIPNGYDRGRTPPLRHPAPDPVFLMVGLLTYVPNQDAAVWFAREVFPHVRRELPNARFRVVGRYGSAEQVAPLRDLPGVEVTGEVPDIAVELAAAHVSVVPVRFGGGTRIKILEAFARRVPVVTTNVGCEGLDVVSGQQLCIADEAGDFAAACVQLVRDPEGAARLVAAGEQLWQDAYCWSGIASTLVALVRETAA